MAQFVNMFEVDLDKRSYPANLNQTVSEGNVSSNQIGAYVYKDGQPYNLGGNCTGLVMRADGSTVPLTGVIDDNAAYVVLDQPSCAIPGPIQVAVNWVSGSNTTTLVVAYGTVIHTDTRSYIQPGTPIPDIDQLLAEIDNMREATADAEAAATKSVRYDTVQSLTSAQKVQACDNIGAALDTDVTNLKSDVLNADVYDLAVDMSHINEALGGVTFAWNGNECTVTGTATMTTWTDLFISSNTLPQNIKGGDVLRIKYSAQNVYLYVYDYSGGNITILKGTNSEAVVKIPENCSGLIIRLWVGNGTTVNETVEPRIYINDNCIVKSVDVASEVETGKTDMRDLIQDMLNIYGYCKLASGDYYINTAIKMPQGSMIQGCGESTKIRLKAGNNQAAIRMTKFCNVSDLCVIGAYNDLTQSDFTETSGSRYGIQYYKAGSDTYQTAYCSITNVHIRNFSGAGIYQYGTGANVEQGLFVSNVHIKNCWCGVHIYANSEFCRYVNLQITYCYIACINNGGNNSFDNCVFHAYSIGMRIDGLQNNSAHGMCSNSSFCHTGNNSGSAIYAAAIGNGYVFSSCQFWYNSIDLDDCGGIVFSGCEFGRGTTGAGATINISGGNTVMFVGSVFMNDVTYPPNITITNNTKVKFDACYGSVSGNVITA